MLALTVERARALGLTYGLLQPWYDIDTCDDLVTFLNRNKNRKDGCGPGWRTLNYLKEKQIALTLEPRREDKERSTANESFF